ncbi:hypothetical protein HF086_005783 [Spodoptera exigua]|uniref:DUF5641 domain-containing protein n=1 Tax=Spodoptera exigua TaxID=7107 RepID=A0A922SJ61_SPOEX|nr:hypothetical protein HF086_005783 [Spodoptera exigua]
MSEAKMSELIKKRAVVKGRLTVFESYLKRCKCPLDDQQILELQLRIDNSSSLLDNYSELQSLIEENVDELDLPKQLDDRDRFEEQYYKTVASAKLLLKNEVPVNNNNLVGKSKMCVKLPDIKIPTFDGSYDRWLEFRNSYCSMIHERQDLDCIQKFHYLRSSLTNSASQVISALEFTAENYFHAWGLLEDRYNNLRLLQHNHVKSLYTIPSLHKESASQLRKLIDTVRRNLRALSSLGEETHAWDTLIIYLVVSKLDPSTEREWEQYQGTLYNANTKPPFVKLEDLLKFLKDRADMLDIIKVQCNYSQTLDTQLKLFWELEEIPNAGNILSADEQKCENIFAQTTARTREGRFSVRIPFKESPTVLGESYDITAHDISKRLALGDQCQNKTLDSTIVLGWLRMSPHSLKTFVQNRVVEINELTSNAIWSHVGTKKNPADLVSRGVSSDTLSECSLWWNGPPFLQCHELMESQQSTNSLTDYASDLPELKPHTTTMRIEQLRQQFWKRWSTDYISELQTRTKWKTHNQDLALNTLAVIKEDHLPPLKWRMGRIVKVFTGTDGVSRVAELRTTTGSVQRAFSKICPLPVPSTTSGGQDNKEVSASSGAAI